MLAAAQRFLQQLYTFNGTLTLSRQFGPAERLPQFFQPLVMTAGNEAQTVCLSATSNLHLLLHGLVPKQECMVHFIV
jgi:hypothetical protein